MRRLTGVIAACLVLLAPATALADADAVVKDCTLDGVIQHHHSQKDYSEALKHLPTDVDEYSDCRDVIRRAQLSGAGSGGNGGAGGTNGATGGGTGGGTNPGTGSGAGAALDPLASATPEEKAAVEQARSASSTPVNVGGTLVRPGALGFGGQGSPTKLPGSLIAVLVALGLASAGAAGTWVRNRVVARRGA